MSPESVPVLIIGYRRPDLVAQVMRAVADARPHRLFLACDGAHPSRPAEIELVEATRRAMEDAVTWPCTVERLYHETNQGCRKGVVSAIDWFFSHVEAGIILEDDCIPHPDFFPYCAELLNRYSDEPRVMHISGDGALSSLGRSSHVSYVFTNEILVWGWATWRRAWTLYDRDLKRWANLRTDEKKVREVFGSRDAMTYWSRILDRQLLEGTPDTWDYQWTFTVRDRHGLAIVPTRNLITNVGFRADATHTTAEGSPRSNVAFQPLGEIIHPSRLEVDKRLDGEIQSEVRKFKQRVRQGTALGALRALRRAIRIAASSSR